MVRHNERSNKFLQATEILHVLHITFADIRPDKSIKKKREKEKM